MQSSILGTIVACLLGVVTFLFIDAFNRRARGEQFPEYWKSWIFWTVQGFFVIVTVFFALAFEFNAPMSFIFGFIFPALLRQVATQQEKRLRDIDLQHDLKVAEKAAEEKPTEVRPVWEVSRLQLEVYIRKNQAQVNSIYWVTVFVMIVGFALIGFGVFQAMNGGDVVLRSNC